MSTNRRNSAQCLWPFGDCCFHLSCSSCQRDQVFLTQYLALFTHRVHLSAHHCYIDFATVNDIYLSYSLELVWPGGCVLAVRLALLSILVRWVPFDILYLVT